MKRLYFNGDILTMEDNRYAEAVLTEDDKIAAVGDYETVLALGGDAEPIDLEGMTMMPAFLDAHSHFSGYATSMLQVPLDEAVDWEEIKEKIQKFIQDNQVPEGQWVIGKGYDHNRLKERCHPKRQWLDQAAPFNPLVIQHQSGHMGVFNSKALEVLGVTSDTSAPAGGKIEWEDGKLTGYMEENAFIQYFQKVPMSSLEDLMEAYQKAQNRYASYGITTVQEGMMVSQLAPLYQALIQRGVLKLDVVCYADFQERKTLKERMPSYWEGYQDHVRIGGYKIFLDGSPQGRTAWMLSPYQDSEEYYGYGTLTDEQVEERIRAAVGEGRQILAHCNGDAASRQYINGFKKVYSEAERKKEIRPVMVHAQLLPHDQMDEVKDLQMLPSFFVAHVWYWGDTHIQNFGFERAKDISSANTALKKGICFTFHQDAPVIEPNMLETVWCAVNRITRDGVVLGEEERISVFEALKAVTIHAAYQYFEEDTKGSILPGKQADFVFLDRNPLKVSPMDIRNISVKATVKDGKAIYQG